MSPVNTPEAWWNSARDRARTAARASGRDPHYVLREFVYERFLARVFHDGDLPWVLKGGVALLARVEDARYSRDVDLLHAGDDVEHAAAAMASTSTS